MRDAMRTSPLFMPPKPSFSNKRERSPRRIAGCAVSLPGSRKRPLCRWLPKPADSWRIARAIANEGGEERSVAGGRRGRQAGKGRRYSPAAAWLRLCAGCPSPAALRSVGDGPGAESALGAEGWTLARLRLGVRQSLGRKRTLRRNRQIFKAAFCQQAGGSAGGERPSRVRRFAC